MTPDRLQFDVAERHRIGEGTRVNLTLGEADEQIG
jgi:hypothetical protein